MAIPVKIITHIADAQAQLVEQFKKSPRIAAVAGIVGARAQILENAIWDVLTKNFLNATGARLDLIGKMVGQDRFGQADDPTFLKYIQAKILANRTSGLVEDLYSVLALLYDGTIKVEQYYPASFLVRLRGGTPVTPSFLILLARFVRLTKGDGIGGFVQYEPQPETETFVTRPAVFLTAAWNSGTAKTSITVNDPSGVLPTWNPAGGSLTIGADGLGGISFNYTSIAGNVITFGSGTLGGSTIPANSPVYSPGGTVTRGFPVCMFVDVAALAGDMTLSLDASSYDPLGGSDSATIRIDAGTPNQEDVDVSAVMADSGHEVLTLATALQFPHDVRTAVVIKSKTTGGSTTQLPSGKLAGVILA